MISDSRWFIDLMILETEMKVRGHKESTIELYQMIVEEFLDFVDKNSYEIEREDVEEYLDYQSNVKNNSNNTVMTRLSAVDFFLKEGLGLNVTEQIERYAREYKEKDILVTEEIQKLLTEKLAKRNLAIYAISYYLGLGAEDIATLNGDDYILESDGTASLVFTKEGTVKVFENITGQLKQLIDSWMEQRASLLKYKDETAMFVNKNYKRISGRSMQRWFKLDLKTAKLNKKVTFSTLRYSRAYEMTLNGKYDAAADFLGYQEKGRLMRYFKEIGIYIKPKE